MSIDQDLAGKVVVITGAGRGIGKQLAIGAAEHGARLALVEVVKENLDATVKGISASGAEIRGYHTDLGVESQVVENFKAIEKDFGQIDCLVNQCAMVQMEFAVTPWFQELLQLMLGKSALIAIQLSLKN
ncbi:MAG: SDR family NAD(P)-dependent oxidoreductase [Actinobacteria bacterium]|nr:SDR family NAD(P)-dependent oxidoreductase [Actinomycetota bacterium]